jgi:hypothetical protein
MICMKKLIIIIILVTVLATGTGLYYRPSFTLIGQLDWWNVLTKGAFVGSFQSFFTQGMIDESFFYVMRYTAGGLVGGVILAMLAGGKSKSKTSKKK